MKKLYLALSFLFIMLFTLCSCISSNDTPSSTTSNESTTKPTEVTDEITFDDLYDINNKVRIEINIKDEELIKLQNDYDKYSNMGSKSPIYRLCDLVTIIVTKNNKEYKYEYEQVGVRMKGNTSRKNFFNTETKEIYDNIHLKLSFDELFDDPYYYTSDELLNLTEEEKLIRSEREFLGQSALDLRYQKSKDTTYIKEYYALEMYRAYGIISSHSNLTELAINHSGKNLEYGLYLMTEASSKSLIKNSLKSQEYINFDNWKTESKGTIGIPNSKYGQYYKASYGVGSIISAPDMTSSNPKLFGLEDKEGYTPPYELKTNKDNVDHTQIINTFNIINNQDYTSISEVVDLEYFAMYEAIATILGSPDDLRNNANNYMLYFRRTDGKMTIIPIDQDRVLGIGSDWNPTNDNMTSINQYSTYMAGANKNQTNNLYLKTILSDTPCKELYLNNITTILNSEWVSVDKFNSIYNIAYNHYKDYVKTCLYNLEFSLEANNNNLSFNDYITKKINSLTNSTPSTPDYDNKDTINMNNISSIYLAGYANWDFDENYKFKLDTNNNYVLSFKIEKEFSFKIRAKYTDGSDKWYRALSGEILHEGDNVSIDSTNIGKTINLSISPTGILTIIYN